MAKYLKNKVFTIDGVNEIFKTLADAKAYISTTLTIEEYLDLTKANKGKTNIRQWVKDEVATLVAVQGKKFFTKPIKIDIKQ